MSKIAYLNLIVLYVISLILCQTKESYTFHNALDSVGNILNISWYNTDLSKASNCLNPKHLWPHWGFNQSEIIQQLSPYHSLLAFYMSCTNNFQIKVGISSKHISRSHHYSHVRHVMDMVAPRNMFGWDTYFNLKVICTAHIEG